ncbi:uncharacterized protein LAESUDRAFT_731925 [Laetiporus sulphureus 93-53]|uniref:Uncharacterized protein n=1 Tax=Laetiporus sulphureus 93-53 TaxID=1314785 RepID=A0A165BD09_9APHY|nr:uncharacterized protein LAESUDRAFT_731925 [Laetiporus sulphureus 93-53]KZT00774.1 hypothetical protein LAESUDRAFT_731925 [Laetiporus sulphureus 93-53]
MSLRAPTPLRSTPSTAPLEAMIATKQAHIEELVAERRPLEHTIGKLRQSLCEEQARAKDAIASLELRWKEERAEWREGCDTLQAAHRIAHLRTAADLDSERLSILKSRDEMRRERLARLQRDYRLVAFQRREFELDNRVSELEWALEDVKANYEDDMDEVKEDMEEKTAEMEARHAKLTLQLQEASAKLAAAQKEMQDTEKAISRLRAEHTTVLANRDSEATSLERVTLQYESLKTAHAELEAKFRESEHTREDLRRQVDKWRNLENREGAEMDALRRSRIELEVRVRELESRLKEAEAAVEENRAAVDKAKGKTEKYRAALEEHKKTINDAYEEHGRLETELRGMNSQLEDAKRQIETLELRLSAQRAKADAATADTQTAARSGGKQSKGKKKAFSLSGESDFEMEIEEVSIQQPPPQAAPSFVKGPNGHPKPRPAYRSPHQTVHTHDGYDEEVQEVESTQRSQKQRRENRPAPQASSSSIKESNGRPRPRPAYKSSQTVAETHAEDDEIEEVESPQTTQTQTKGAADKSGRRRSPNHYQGDKAGERHSPSHQGGRKRGRPKKKQEVTVEDDDDGVEIVEEKSTPAKKGKRKAGPPADEEASDKQALPRKRSKKKKMQSLVDDEASEGESTQKQRGKKKARKDEDDGEEEGLSSRPVSRASKVSGNLSHKGNSNLSSIREADHGASDSDGIVDKEAAKPKKKRKLGIFGSARPQSFEWNTLVGTGSTLDIPINLSPIKENSSRTPREFLGRASLAFGSIASFGSRR